MAIKLGRVLTYGRRRNTQTLKSSPTSCSFYIMPAVFILWKFFMACYISNIMTALTCFMSLYSVGIYLLKLTMEAPEQFVKSIQSSY